MSSDLAIRVEGLGKAYTIRHQQSDHVTLAQVALERARHPFRRSERERFWALEDVSFEVRQGEVLGLIGRNGAGKSTLLKCLTRITEPTAGRIELWGRVGSLLEVGTGFHPELTGRENVYLNGSILGMNRKEIDRQFDAIVEFAGVEKFLDTPVKRYSSGMYVRLAFAVAAHLETEILLVDEVLAVGDQEFQRRSLGKMGELAAGGRTVLFVSHQLGAIRDLTSRAIYLRGGTVLAIGATAAVLDRYASDTLGPADPVDLPRLTSGLPGTVVFESVRLAHESAVLEHGQPIEFDIVLAANEHTPSVRVSLTVFATDGSPVCSGFTAEVAAPEVGECLLYRLAVKEHQLAPGRYHLALATGTGDDLTGHDDWDIVGPVAPFEIGSLRGPRGPGYWASGWGHLRLERPLFEVLEVSRPR